MAKEEGPSRPDNGLPLAESLSEDLLYRSQLHGKLSTKPGSRRDRNSRPDDRDRRLRPGIPPSPHPTPSDAWHSQARTYSHHIHQ